MVAGRKSVLGGFLLLELLFLRQRCRSAAAGHSAALGAWRWKRRRERRRKAAGRKSDVSSAQP